MSEFIGTRTLNEWRSGFPILNKIIAGQEVTWLNPNYGQERSVSIVTSADVADAEERLRRFAPYFEAAFPETRSSHGFIESPLYEAPKMMEALNQRGVHLPGRLMMKADSELPISGSIKARGGIYEVLKTAEQLAIAEGMLKMTDNYAKLADVSFSKFFSQYSIAVGSTGNLGLSIGIVGARLGFHTTVHMSHDASQWKKDLLREKGAYVKEYSADYSVAVREGRKQAAQDPHCHFIDDENSKDLFVGYATAGKRLKKQFEEAGISVDADHPLFVYLPCGVGGGPGGVTFGLKKAFGAHVHAFFVEPTHAPCFLLGLLTGLNDQVSVQDFGLDNKTAADGLAVPRASAFVGKEAGSLISGCMTVRDDRLFQYLKTLADTEHKWIEPSAAAGLIGPQMLLGTDEGRNYLKRHQLADKMTGATHVFWATGGGMVPKKIRESYYHQGSRI
ncbi:D-serine ammonia-lyase [Sporolactobacillus laevolacticus]|uniref:Probable D-serine dehydratase n=1 Tax=Sporolactobacillus laevolacticus DSM 442 TaxID=1395513 RepID=V6IUF2_9BACL|nr:D-serine ammonia-lyase [Sporolactobacillus laevolacticus]EST10693.1 D-serine dehydratase [Sporolactobacillus laevolacticus DSM 442]